VRPRAIVTIDSLYEVIYEELIDTNMNDLDLCPATSQNRGPHKSESNSP